MREPGLQHLATASGDPLSRWCRCAVGVLWRMESSEMAGWAPLKKMVGSLPAWLYVAVSVAHL